jgi:UDP-glucose 4-epimerase
VGRFLCTGCFGFIGSHLIERLLAEGHEVHVVDDLSSSPLPLSELLDELGHPTNLTYDIMPLRTFYSPEGWDGIYHLASRVGPAGILQHAGEMIRSIVDDTYHVINFARRSRCRLLFVSTSEIYNGGDNGYCTETTPATVPAQISVRTEYGVAKLAAEVAVINTCKVTELDAVLVRPFNVCGPRQSDKGGFVLARFARQALHGEPLTIFGTGEQVRAFTDVRDIAEGLILAMERGKSGEVYNLGDPAGKMSIRGLAHHVISALPDYHGLMLMTEGKAVYGPLWEDAKDKYPDATKAMNELSWQPQYGIRQTIQDILAYERGKVKA